MSYQFSDNIQRGIIYLAKSNADFYHQISNLVKPEYFEYPSHQNMFSVIQDYFEKYKKLPTDAFIIENVKKVKSAKEMVSDYEDEIEYVNALTDRDTSNPDYFLDLVEEFARRQAMKEAIASSVDLIAEGKYGQVEDLVSKALQISRNVDIGQSYYDDFKDRWDRVFNPEFKDYLTCFLPSINNLLEGGLGRKEAAMVIAPPGVGKSVYLVNEGVHALMQNKKVLYVSLEMSEDKIAQRFDSVMTLIPQKQLKEPGVQPKVAERLKLFQESFPESRLMIKEFPTGQATVNTVRSLMVELRNREDFVPDLVIVDYLELLRPVREIEQEHRAQQRIIEELRGLAVEQNLSVWTATQTNRQGRTVSVITDAELGDSYGKIRPVDFAISLNQTTEEFDQGRMRGYIVKSRNGRPKSIIPIHIDYNTLKMEETPPVDVD